MANSPPPPPPLPPLSLSNSPPLNHLPPPLHSPGTNSFPVIAIAVIGILATALVLITYYIFVIKCCLNWHRLHFLTPFFSRARDSNNNIDSSPITTTVSLDRGTVHKGLEELVIRSIPVIKFRKVINERKVAQDNTQSSELIGTVSYECAVCLSEFDEGEKLRVIPYCCHAFHIDCIDVWLQSNANCPLCRSGISPASILYNAHSHVGHFPITSYHKDNKDEVNKDVSNSNDEDHGEKEHNDYMVIEIEGNNLDEPRLVNRELLLEERKIQLRQRQQLSMVQSKCGMRQVGYVCSMGDELIDMRKKDEEFQVEPIRRSISMDLSNERDFCIEIEECCSSSKNVSCGGGGDYGGGGDDGGCSNKVRRFIFSFGYGRSSRCSVEPVHLHP